MATRSPCCFKWVSAIGLSRSVDFQRLRPASGQHARAYVSPRSVLYAFPRLRVLSRESAGAGLTMKPRPAE